MHLIKNTSIDFLKYRKVAYVISLSLVLAGVVSLFVRGLNYGIDFRGGTEVVLRFDNDVEIGDVRTILKEAGVDGAIKRYGADRSVLVQTGFDGDLNQLRSLVSNALGDRLPDNPHEVLRIDSVGPSIASDLKWAALKALLGAIVAILLYVGIRFEFRFAAASVVAIFHDVFIVLGIFSIFGGMFDFMPLDINQSIIAAFLTIAGYSINDTVVVYDRIRENIRVGKSGDYLTIFNNSLNQTLSRTIITSGTTLLVVLVLFIFAGPAIRGFTFAILLGIIVGTYSSLFIAAPVVLEWQLKSKRPIKLRGG
ncbi:MULTISPECIES: protein translocase subunit SecF [Prosthecochloris]|uniref:Protein-export membrane protein SecF n=1 Tax=Prosthecochloris marina TaxID=2017681 RepID=A0A317T3L9_9CHLB|nr:MULTISPECIES: protein translocase subunit SecF [Prosthecochloris]PWW81302.1 protein translocase subunit SecF [Prosthecochloris marina]UZJ37642.1 protein translocase subunit SecF [Prosthecochloris sp. SCSIO W1103]UZJ39461.1 protein translocase subunit SecF [Prosthecochloris sp. SCSIO W1102]